MTIGIPRPEADARDRPNAAQLGMAGKIHALWMGA